MITSRSPCLVLAVALLLGSVSATCQQSGAPSSPVPPRVVLHFEEPWFEARATEAVAEVWELAAQCMDLTAARRDQLHVYNDTVACQAIATKHGQTYTQSSPGFVLAETHAAQVLFWRCGWCRDARWRIGHLTMELALTEASPLAREQWPVWFDAGLAAYAEGPFRSATGWVEARSHMSREPDSLHLVRALGDRLPTVASLLTEATDSLSESQQRATHRLLWVFLFETHGAATRSALRTSTTATSRTAAGAAMVDGLRRELGEEVWRGLDTGFVAFIDQLPQTIDHEVYPAIDVVGQPGGSDFVPGSPAVTWLDRNSKSTFVVTARPQLVQVGQGDLVFERSHGRWVRVTLLAHNGRGWVFVSERIVQDDRPSGWTVLASTSVDVPSIRIGNTVDLQVAVKGRNLAIRVAGSEVLDVAVAGASLAGRFGVGGPFGNQVAWRGVRLR